MNRTELFKDRREELSKGITPADLLNTKNRHDYDFVERVLDMIPFAYVEHYVNQRHEDREKYE